MKRLTITMFLVSMVFYAQAQNEFSDTLRLSVEQAVVLSLKQNPNLRGAQLEKDITQRQLQAAKGAALPQAKATAGFTDNFSLPQQLLPGEIFGQTGQIPVAFGVRYGVNGGVEISQMLYNQSYLSNLKKLGAAQDAVDLQILSTKESLVFNVAQTYILVQTTQAQEALLLSNLDRVNQLLKTTQSQYENGLVKKVDVDQVKVNKTNLESELANLRMGLLQQTNLMCFYLGLSTSHPIVLTEELATRDSYPLAPELMLSQNINYRLLGKQKELAMMDERAIRSGYLPSLSAFAQYNYTGQANELNFDDGNYSNFKSGLWGLNLSVPIFDGFQRKRQIQESKLRQEQLDFDIQNLQNSTRMEFDNATSKIALNKTLVSAQEENMELAQSVYAASQLSFEEGVASLTELLNAETGLKEAQSQYLTALITLKLSELEYLKTSGQLAQLIQANS